MFIYVYRNITDLLFSYMRDVLSDLPSDVTQQYMYLHIIIAYFMLTNLRILKCGLWIQNEVDKITNKYFTGTVKEIT